MLNTKQIGIITFGISIFLAILVVSFFFSMNRLVGTTICPSEINGQECPVHTLYTTFFPLQIILGTAGAMALAIIGLFLITQEKKIREKAKTEKKKTELEVISGVLTTDEKKIVEILKEQPGIPQNTLRLKVDFSKAKLSMLLKEMEGRKLIKKEPEGKTFRVYLRK